jgi:MFS family permease
MVVALAAAPYSTLMPAIVHEVFAGNAETLGFLVGAAGLGAIGGTLLLASRPDVRGLVRLIIAAAFIAGCALMALAWSRWLALSLVMMTLIGFGILIISVATNMILQAIVDDDKRGRVMSLYTVAFLGVIPLGGLIAGTLADRISATNTVLAGGSVCVLAALYMMRLLPLLRRHMRPIYARLGISSE